MAKRTYDKDGKLTAFESPSDGYMLEALKFDTEFGEKQADYCGKAEHIGYVNKIFETKQEAALYYDENNPLMRSLNAYGTYQSDWDPHTKLLYIVRKHHGYEYKKLPPLTKNTVHVQYRRNIMPAVPDGPIHK